MVKKFENFSKNVLCYRHDLKKTDFVSIFALKCSNNYTILMNLQFQKFEKMVHQQGKSQKNSMQYRRIIRKNTCTICAKFVY